MIPWRRDTRIALIVIDAGVALSAYAGSWYGIFGAPDVPRSWLDGTPFDSYLVPSYILGCVVGNAHLLAAILLASRSTFGGYAAIIASGVLAGWIITQVLMVGFHSWLQPAMLVISAVCAELAAGLAATADSLQAGVTDHRRASRPPRRRPLGPWNV